MKINGVKPVRKEEQPGAGAGAGCDVYPPKPNGVSYPF